MKKTVFLVVLIISLTFCSTSYAEESISLFINDQKVFSNPPPIMYQDRVFVPVRIVSESLGANVVWSNNIVSVTLKGKITLDQWFNEVSFALKTFDSLRAKTLTGTPQNNKDSAYDAAKQIDDLIFRNTSYVPPDKAANIHPYFVNLLVIERERFQVFAEGIRATQLGNYQQASRMVGATDYLGNRSSQLSDIIYAQLKTFNKGNNDVSGGGGGPVGSGGGY